MLKMRHYIIIGSVVFIAILVANMPARLLFDPLKSKLLINPPSQLQIGEAKGSIWQGHIDLGVSGVPFRADWDILQSHLFKGSFAVAFSLTSLSPNNINAPDWIKGNVFGSILGRVGCFDVNGLVSAGLINQFAKGQFSLENNIALNSLNISFKNQAFGEAGGELHWPGGLVDYYDPSRGQRQVTLPALKAALNSQEGTLMSQLTIDGVSDGFSDGSSDGPSNILVSAEIDGQGEAYVAIRKRMLDVLGQNWSKMANPDDVILEIQQALF